MKIKFSDLKPGDVILGESGNKCVVYEIEGIGFGVLSIVTEFGYLTMDPNAECVVVRE